MAAEVTSGATPAVVGTEHTLATLSNPGTYQLVVDASALAAGDAVTLRLYGRAGAADPEALAYEATWAGPVATPLLISLPVLAVGHWRASLEQGAGTGRTFPWSVRSI
ncbi:hypothetical protein [Roseospirillum parvum]|uniref:Uncharacterized protein n=1 Tax=Roseospirillum parvum TaxID=83401 RepID=A0A1G8G115_9PROT|nr:hypothetical protein [Roseospirillum parvum]SDH88073.1 hypothetical protein SAMN05421742_1188 [Roseospirillum parvum]